MCVVDGLSVYAHAKKGDCPIGKHTGEKWIEPPSKEPEAGPGTELAAILKSLGIEPDASCSCKEKMRRMNAWGVDGCTKQREEIIGWMREGQTRWGWRDKLTAAAKAIASGLAFKLNACDPFPSLVDEAIRRAAIRL